MRGEIGEVLARHHRPSLQRQLLVRENAPPAGSTPKHRLRADGGHCIFTSREPVDGLRYIEHIVLAILGRGGGGVHVGDDFAATLGEANDILQDTLWVAKLEKGRPREAGTAERVLVQLKPLRRPDVVRLATIGMINEI